MQVFCLALHTFDGVVECCAKYARNWFVLKHDLEEGSSIPLLPVAEGFSGEIVCVVHNFQLPAVYGDHSANVQHVWLDGVISAAFEEGLPVLDVVLQVSRPHCSHC